MKNGTLVVNIFLKCVVSCNSLCTFVFFGICQHPNMPLSYMYLESGYYMYTKEKHNKFMSICSERIGIFH